MSLSSIVRAFKNLPKFAPLLLNKPNAKFASVFPARFQSTSPEPVAKNKIVETKSIEDKLMEFFDEQKNWAVNELRVGRSWNKDELRIKSNKDLHVLWYVLLKERNMLFTMEQECKRAYELFPNPERIDKVNDSMKNLEEVVRERNRAYHLLETGETGERPAKLVPNQLGIKFYYRHFEHSIPKYMNKKWRENHIHRYHGHAVNKFLNLYREKLFNEKRKSRNRDTNHVIMLIRKFPNLNLDAVRAQYPGVNLEKALNSKKARGHYIPKEFQ